MGSLISVSAVAKIKANIARIRERAVHAIRMTMRSDADIKLSGSRQCAELREELLKVARDLKTVSPKVYLENKKSFESLYKGLSGCVVKEEKVSQNYSYSA